MSKESNGHSAEVKDNGIDMFSRLKQKFSFDCVFGLLIIGLMSNAVFLLPQNIMYELGVSLGFLDEVGGLVRLFSFGAIAFLQRKTISKYYKIYLLLFFLLLFVNYLIFDGNQSVMRQMFLVPGILIIFTMSLAYASFTNPDKLIQAHIIVAVPIILMNLINTLIGLNANGQIGLNYLSFGYQSIVFVTVLVMAAYRTGKRFYVISAISSLVILLVFANRGAVLISLLMVVVFMIYYSKSLRQFVLSLTALVAIVSLLFFVPSVSSGINSFLEDWGISSRTLISVNVTPDTENISDDDLPQLSEEEQEAIRESTNTTISAKVSVNTRIELWKDILRKVMITPIIGEGIGADRILYGLYAHNFVLEMLLNFGMVFGGIIIAIVAYFGLKLLYFRDKNWRDLILVYFVVGFATLMLSLSFYSHFETNLAIALYCAFYSSRGFSGENNERDLHLR